MDERPLKERIEQTRYVWARVKDVLPNETEFKTKTSRAKAAATLTTLAAMLNSIDDAPYSQVEDCKGEMIKRYWADLNALTLWLVANPDPAFQAQALKAGRKYIRENEEIGITIRCGDWKFMVYRALSYPRGQLEREQEEDGDDSDVEARL